MKTTKIINKNQQDQESNTKFYVSKFKNAKFKITHNIHKRWRRRHDGGGSNISLHKQQTNYNQTPTNSKFSFLKN